MTIVGGERKSRVAWYNAHLGGNLDVETRNKLIELLTDFGIALEDEANKFKINIFSSFGIFREFHLIAAITSSSIMYVTSPSSGGFVHNIWLDLRRDPKQPDMDDLCQIANRRFGWTNFWYVQFPSDILQKDSNAISEELRIKAKAEVQETITQSEIEARLVRINPIFKSRDFYVENDLCFVLLPFQASFLRIYEEHVRPTLEKLGFRVMKADDLFTPTEIIEDVWELINKARIVVADVTGRNANVFYELGITHTIGKDTLIITQNSQDVPFDLQHRRYLTYVDNVKGWEGLRRDLNRAVDAVMKKV